VDEKLLITSKAPPGGGGPAVAARISTPAAQVLSADSTRLVDGRHLVEDVEILVVMRNASGNQCWAR